MSNIRRDSKPWKWAIPIAIVLFFLSMVSPYCDYLWFLHDARQPQVFLLAVTTKGTLFSIALVLGVALSYFSLLVASKATLVYHFAPETAGEKMISNVLGYIQEKSALVTKLAALVIGLMAAGGLSTGWQDYLLSQNGKPFGVADPLFGRDISFFVFTLPWLETLSTYAVGLTFLTMVATIAVYGSLQGLASLGKIELARPGVRMHIAVIVALFIGAVAWKTWIGRYGFAFMENRQFTGAGYSGVTELGARTVLSYLLGLTAIIALLAGRTRKPLVAIAVPFAACSLWYVLGIMIYPSLVQRFSVDPDKLAKEGPFATSAIKMTRFAYGLDEVEVRETDSSDAPTQAELKASEDTLRNMRLWDPEVMRRAADGIQSLRPYYRFYDVDVDRYTIDGKPTTIMISPRDIDVNGLSQSARTWVNERLQYTHGFGVIAAGVNGSTASGKPLYLAKDIPAKSTPELTLTQPRVYFSDFRLNDEQHREDYVLVDSKVDEFDYPEQSGETRYRWTAERGVPVGGLIAKLAFSYSLGDGNLLVSSNVTKDTRLIYRRSILDRAGRVYPFLQFDDDPYVVISKGRLIWILDAYTITDRIPYSATLYAGRRGFNYIRNSVKLTIDAYSGEMRAYAINPDPILEAYQRIYPNLIEPGSKLPSELRAHLRYPEDLLRSQAIQLAQYHVLDPVVFLNNEDAWEISAQRGLGGGSEEIRPYYVRMVLPGESSAEFLQILPMSPRQRNNLSGWIAARCDGENYGKLLLYRYPKTRNIPGPAQMEAFFNQDKEIADINRQLNNDQSQIVVGNLLVVPIGKSVMYVEPLFLQSRSSGIQPIPELRKVILGLEGKVVVGDTYEEALGKLFGNSRPSATPPKADPADTVAQPKSTDWKADIRRAKDLLEQADAALRKGDFATYGELQKQLKAALEGLAK